MEQRRFILFLILSLAILLGWLHLGPILFPNLFPKPAKPDAKQDDGKGGPKDEPGEDGKPQPATKRNLSDQANENSPADDTTNTGTAKKTDEEEQLSQVATVGKSAKYPHKIVTLGSLDPNSGYFLQFILTTRGAAVLQAMLNDTRYRELKNTQVPLKVIGNEKLKLNTLETSLVSINQKSQPALDQVNWQIVPDSQSRSGVTFRIQVPGVIEVVKQYQLKRLHPQEIDKLRDTSSSGYTLTLEQSITNISNEAISANYTLQGPVGLPLENVKNTRIFRSIKVGFLDDTGSIIAESLTAADIANSAEENKLEEWKSPLRYIGVDTQYFTALLLPDGNQLKRPSIEITKPILVERAQNEEHSDISVQLISFDIDLAAGKSNTHRYTLFAGPKRRELLEPLGAVASLDFSTWFGIGYVSKAMLALLGFLNSWGIAYGFAIVIMTVIVRGCMYPISKKQAVGAKKMKDLQPQISELKKKYGKDKEKMAKAQMELFSKNNYNPLAGCLPIFLQLPIFIGLYQSLNMSVDLRLAPFPFTWINDLAAPDALFPLPFVVPLLGWTEFNLLPFVTVTIFLFQQKMFMPPPTDEQSAMQQKMMNYMMIFFGFMFYRMPSGLLVYFIASSLWGIGERKLLDFSGSKSTPKPNTSDEKKPKKENFWSRIIAHIDAAAQMKQSNSNPATGDTSTSDKGSKKKKKKKSRSRR